MSYRVTRVSASGESGRHEEAALVTHTMTWIPCSAWAWGPGRRTPYPRRTLSPWRSRRDGPEIRQGDWRARLAAGRARFRLKRSYPPARLTSRRLIATDRG